MKTKHCFSPGFNQLNGAAQGSAHLRLPQDGVHHHHVALRRALRNFKWCEVEFVQQQYVGSKSLINPKLGSSRSRKTLVPFKYHGGPPF